MGELLLSQTAFLDVDPFTAFHMFGSTDSAGWIMAATVGAVRTGSPVEFAIPFPDHSTGVGSGAGTLRGTGRIGEVVPWRRIVLHHESPWSGQTVVTFAPESAGTRVRATSEVSPDAIRWMKHRIGEPDADMPDESICLGLMTSVSGGTGLFGRATINCAELAADEINREGGVLGRRIRIVHTDEATDPQTATSALQRLMSNPNLAAVIGSHTSKTLNAMLPTILGNDVLYLYAPVNEGGARVGNLFRLGESSRAQMHFAIPRLAQQANRRNWYLLGNDYSWPREIARVARQSIDVSGGRVVRDRYLPFGRRKFDDVLADIESSGAEVLVSSLIGFDSIDFERAFVDSGLRKQIVTLAPLLEDSTLDHLGNTADGIWSPMSYFGNEAANSGFLDRYHRLWGDYSPPPSSISASVYDSIHLWARAAHRARSIHPTEVAAALHGTSIDGARGSVTVTSDGTLSSDMYLATVQGGQFIIDDNLGRASIG